MGMTEQQRLAAFSDTVRNSTLKRLKRVPEGAENWSIAPGAMSFADIAYHILENDRALFKIFETKRIGAHIGEAGAITIQTRSEFEDLIEELKKTKKERSTFIYDLTPADLDVIVEAERIRGVERIPAGTLILEVLDHEVHHRGQLAAYLRVHEAGVQT